MSSSRRLVVSVLVLLELLLVGPVAYNFVRVERQPLDVQDRLSALIGEVSAQASAECSSTATSGACREERGRYVWDWAPAYHFHMRLLVEGTECDLASWSKLVDGFASYAEPLGREFRVPVHVESSVLFHANVALLKKGAVQGKVTADAVKQSLHKIIDEAEVGGPGEQDDRPVNLAAWCMAAPRNESLSDSLSYRIPSWGVVGFTPRVQDSLGIFKQYTREAIFGLGSGSDDSALAKRRTLGRGLFSVMRNLQATKALAESLPHLPVVSTVSQPFEEALSLVEKAMLPSTELDTALTLVRRASLLANSISSDPSLIPQLFVSDENLFAVFAPMILPTMLPLFIGCVQELKKRLRR